MIMAVVVVSGGRKVGGGKTEKYVEKVAVWNDKLYSGICGAFKFLLGSHWLFS